MSDEERKLILLSDFIDQRVRKQNEIEFYEKELQEIERKLFFLRKEQQLTVTIIDILTKEKVYDIKEEMEKKYILEIEEKNTDN